MSGKVKVKVADHHIRTSINIGRKKATKQEPVKVSEDNPTVQSCLEQGSLEVVDNFLEEDEDEAERGDDGTGETDSQENRETGEPEEETEKDAMVEEQDLEEYTVTELREKCSEKDLKKSGTKQELIDRLKE